MRQFAVEIVQVATSLGLFQVWCGGAVPAFQAGQAALVLSDLPSQPFLRVAVYPFHVQPEGFEFCLDLVPPGEETIPHHPLAGLRPGDKLDVVGPCGRGFDLGGRPANLLVVANSLARLFALVDDAIARRWAISLLSLNADSQPGVPKEVEVHRGALTVELADWADVIALDCSEPGSLVERIRQFRPDRPRGFVQALLSVPMPCGTGACQACRVEPSPRHQLACVDGPVMRY